MRASLIVSIGWTYQHILKPLLFLRDPEKAHASMTAFGERLGRSRLARRSLAALFRADEPSLHQELFDLSFRSPFGLAAGFDYEARLTQVLPAIGFGFGTVGTLTLHPYEGNPRPMLGRLPRSGSLMVNKGFKNLGVAATLARLEGASFEYPVGVSIGKTNTAAHATQAEGVADVVAAFRAAEDSGAPFAYYELNISCPNVAATIEFYEPEHLEELLAAVEKLHLVRPVFVKMPISKSDEEVRAMLDVIVRHPFVRAAVFGNLQRDREHPTLVPEEVAHWPEGNFSGVPTRARSDYLIGLAYREYGEKIKIIGCGGVFSAEDAYRKIKLGASLVQLITGMVFQGPQLVAQMDRDLTRMLARDGYRTIGEAVGAGVV